MVRIYVKRFPSTEFRVLYPRFISPFLKEYKMPQFCKSIWALLYSESLENADFMLVFMQKFE